MREFYLYTPDLSKYFDLNVPTALAAEPRGLGNSFSPSYKESNSGKHLTNVTPSFEPITFLIYFNADGSDGYINYKTMLYFLEECGTSEFVLEYRDGVTRKFCDVLLKSITKSEINEEGVFAETLTLDRQSYWYEAINEDFEFGRYESEPSFPLTFPIAFQGANVKKEKTLTNRHFTPAPIILRISGEITADVSVYIKDTNGNTVSEVLIANQLPQGSALTVDPTTKKITITDGNGKTSNGYGLVDKTKQSFLYLPHGTYTIGSNVVSNADGKVSLRVKKYLLD